MKFFATISFVLAASAATASARSLRSLQVSDTAVELLNAINEARASSGLSLLCLSAKLSSASQNQANDMAAGGFISPVRSDGSMPTERAQGMGFNTQAVFEVVGAGYSSASVAVEEWMKLEDSDQYLLGDFQFLGAAKTDNADQQYQSFWVVDHAQGEDEECVA